MSVPLVIASSGWAEIEKMLNAPFTTLFIAIGTFIDDFPVSIITYGAMLGTIVIAFHLVVLRLGNLVAAARRLFALNKPQTIQQQRDDLRVFAQLSAALIFSAFLATVSFVFTFWPYLLLLQDAGGKPAGFFAFLGAYASAVGRSMVCGAWHSWKGIPEYIFQWAETILMLPFRPSELFSYSCGNYYGWVSKTIAYLVSPLLLMFVLLSLRIAWKNYRTGESA